MCDSYQRRFIFSVVNKSLVLLLLFFKDKLFILLELSFPAIPLQFWNKIKILWKTSWSISLTIQYSQIFWNIIELFLVLVICSLWKNLTCKLFNFSPFRTEIPLIYRLPPRYVWSHSLNTWTISIKSFLNFSFKFFIFIINFKRSSNRLRIRRS